MSEVPRVWVGCLGCYAAGWLNGEWFDAVDAPQDMDEFNAPHIADATGKFYGTDHVAEAHEELWVMDHENFHGLLTGECSPASAEAFAEDIAAIERDGCDVDAVVAWFNERGEFFDGWDRSVREAFEDAYCGEWDSERDYAMELAEEIGAMPREHSWPASYIDWQAATRDLFMDYSSVPTGRGSVYVFRSV